MASDDPSPRARSFALARAGRLLTGAALAAVALSLALAGCASTGDHAEEATKRDTASTPGNAIVVGFETLREAEGKRLIDVLTDEVPQMRVRLNPQARGERCPRISLRGPITGTSFSNPEVYINGTRTSDTCSLTNLSTSNIERVELYPTGNTSRSGYVTHPHGLILIFTRRY